MTTLAEWVSRHAIPEAYRVSRLPSSHGGTTGWQLTLWRAGDAWCAARMTLGLLAPFPEPTEGRRLSARRARPLLQAVERADLFGAPPWPHNPGVDGYVVRVEGSRAGQNVVRESYVPDPVLRDHAWELFHAFGALYPSSWMPWGRVSVQGT